MFKRFGLNQHPQKSFYEMRLEYGFRSQMGQVCRPANLYVFLSLQRQADVSELWPLPDFCIVPEQFSLQLLNLIFIEPLFPFLSL